MPRGSRGAWWDTARPGSGRDRLLHRLGVNRSEVGWEGAASVSVCPGGHLPAQHRPLVESSLWYPPCMLAVFQ